MGESRELSTVFEDSSSVLIAQRAQENLLSRTTPETTDCSAGFPSGQNDGERELARDLGGAGCQPELIDGHVKVRSINGFGLLPSLCSTEETIPPSRPAFASAWQRPAVKDGRRPPRQR